MNDLSKRLTGLSPEKRKLLARALQQREGIFNTFPVSFAQQRLWFLDQWAPGSPAYHIPGVLHMHGALDLAALRRSLQEITRRHEVLRTTFIAIAGQPAQIVHQRHNLSLPIVNIQHLPADIRDAQTQALARREARQPFDLARGPLMRATLLRLGAAEHVLLLTLHHIIADGWSMGVLWRELAALYTAYATGTAADLPDLAIQYADYAVWQRAWLQGDKETRRQGDKQTSRQADKETRLNAETPPPTPNTQHPTPIQELLAYWRQQLDGAPQLLALPTDRPRPLTPSGDGGQERVTLAPALTAALGALGQQAGATLFMTLLAAFQALLARLSGQPDLLVGTAVAGRTQPATEPLIGCFVNTLVLRASLADNPSFQALLARTRGTCLAAYAHQELPFEQLVEVLAPTRDLGHAPLVQVFLTLQNAPLPPLALPGLTLHAHAGATGSAKFDLVLDLTETPDGLTGVLEYDSDLFDAATVARLAGHFQTLLAGAVATPEASLGQLPLLNTAERRQLLVEWNTTAANYPRELSVHQLFAAQAARAPDAVAVVFDGPPTTDHRPPTTDHRSPLHPFTPSPLHPFTGRQLTYRELNERANRLAHYLRSLGVGPEVLVGLCLERSPELVVGLLGVLKAGGAYVPLDPTYPAERLAFMLEDAQVAVLITTTDHRPPTTDHRPPTTDHRPTTTPSPPHPLTPSPPHPLTLSSSWSAITLCAADNPANTLDPSNLAYVIYTSGSTGTPKGVAVAHASLTNLVTWHQRVFAISPTDRATQLASLGFDAASWELWPYLAAGACVALPDEATRTDLPRLMAWLAAQRISISFMPTPLAEAALAMAWPPVSALRLLLTGGDRLHRGPSADHPFTLVNNYGPTETTVVATSTVVAPGSTAAPIGRPIANTWVYLLDQRMEPVPIGVPGELHIGGGGVARGYLNRPELTAERFVPNPFLEIEDRRLKIEDSGLAAHESLSSIFYPLSSESDRLYKTGDLARYLPDGMIEFLGRIDQQVKLRGFRIELGEVEAVLAEHPDVREAVVALREDAVSDRRLVAYVAPTNDQRPTTNDQHDGSGQPSFVVRRSSFVDMLRAFLQERLPDYMIPSAFVFLDTLPLTPSGKVDRRALPAPDQDEADPASYAAPRTPVEERMAQIWAEVLGLTQVGIYDNFFALGGHSLLATQVSARLEAAFQVELPLRELFETPTVAGLAGRIEAAQAAARRLRLLPLVPTPRDRALPLSYAQQRLWLIDQLEPGSVRYNIPIIVRMIGSLDVAALRQSLDTVVQRHEVLRTTFALVDGQPVQQIAPASRLPLAVVDLRDEPAARRAQHTEQLAVAEARRPFELARGLLLRITLLRLDAEEHTLLLTIHHTVFDGWSTGVLIRELAACYRASVTGTSARLPALPAQYADYAVWQRAWLQGSARQGDKETRRQGDTESGVRSQESGVRISGAQHPTPNTQHPTPNTQHPTPIQAQLAYWTQQLADLPMLDLPTDRPRRAASSGAGARLPVALPPSLNAALGVLSRRAGATLFMTLLAAFQALLARYSGQDDFAVGTPIAGRAHPATEPLIGCFVNPLVLRVSLADDPPFQTLLARTRATCLAAYAHQELPFEQLVEALAPTRDLGHAPLVQVFLTLQNAPLPPLVLPGLTLHAHAGATGSAKFDLLLDLTETPDGLVGTLEYDSDLFDAATVARLVGHFQTLLAGAAATPEARLGQLPLLTAAERRQLAQWNATQAEYPHTECFHQLFETQAALRPDTVAVVFDRLPTTDQRPTTNDQRPTTNDPLTPSPLHPFTCQHLTYRELNRRANQLARYLQARGVRPEVRVGICLPRSLEMLVSLLAILKAGGAYVPLDPAYPEERLAFMIEDSQAALLITTTDHRPPTTDRSQTDHCSTTTADASTTTADASAMAADATAMAADTTAMAADASTMAADASTMAADASAMTAEASAMTADASAMVADTSAASSARLPTLRLRSRQVTDDPRPATAIQNPKSKIVNLDADWPLIAAEDVANPASSVAPDNLAYVMYTSGSTGRPKGVLVAHRGVCNSAAVELRALETCPGDRVLQFFSLSFDASLFELAMTLPAGATLHLAPQETLLPGPALCGLLRRQAITIYATAPSVLAALPFEPFPALRTLIVLGEACAAELVARWGATRRVFNAYGPTEATMWAAGTYIDGTRRPPIGRAIANAQVYLLDRQLQLVPVGVVGELYIGGVGLARGYHQRPDLTAERFVPNPFAGVTGDGCWVTGAESSNTRHPTPNTRLYRTGDLARYLVDGEIEYLGRGDAQVKLRGYRIELGEIEAVLRQHEAVHKSVVVAREDVPGEKRLVAYVVPKIEDRRLKIEDSGSSAPEPLSSILYPLSSELRRFLQTKLPDYMVPAAFVTLEALPLMPSGKLDVRALPAPDWIHPVEADEFVAPRTEVEQLVAGIWAAVLGVERIGVHDNFFAIGGHSLLATQTIARLRTAFQVELPLYRLFENPTVAGLATAIAAVRADGIDSSVLPILPAPRDGALPLSFAQQRLWFLDQMEPESPVYLLPGAIRLTGSIDVAALAHSLREIVRRHESLRTTFAMIDERPMQVIAPAQALALPLVDLQPLPARKREETAAQLAAWEARQPFDLARGPLLRTTLVRLAPAAHILLLTMHHIISDGWSIGVFVRDLAALYNARTTQARPSLPALPIQYADYAVWQRAWLQGEQGSGVRGQGDKETRRQGDKETRDTGPQHPTPNTQHPTPIQAQLAYWKRQLAGAPQALALPTDRPRPAIAAIQGRRYALRLAPSLAGALAAFSRRADVTLFMTLLAAFQTLLARYSGQYDLLVGAPIAGRTRAETENLIGCFVNTLALRGDLSGNPSFRALLERVRAVCLGAYAHQDLPFERLVEELQLDRDLSRAPLVQVVFALQNAPMPPMTFPSFSVEPLDVDSGVVKFDLTLTLTPTEQGLVGSLGYATELFDEATISRMLGHFQNLLEGAVAQPDLALADLPLLGDAERRQLLLGWNATTAEYPPDECLHELVEAQATRTPDAVAVVFDRPPTTDHRPPTTDHRPPLHPFTPSPLHPFTGQHLTYCDLDRRANQLAQHLRRLGVRPEQRAGICMERSLELLVAILGVLKAGGAYVPLDPSYPQERLAFMLEDAQVAVLITTNDQRPTTNDQRPPLHPFTPSPLHPLILSPLHPFTPSPCHLVTLSELWPAIAQEPTTELESSVTPDNLAYVIYTSGSTGRPKGAMIPHRGIANRLRWGQSAYRLTSDDRVTQKAPFSFDASIWEIFWPLLAGARLVLARPGGQQDSAYLVDLITRQQVTIAHFVPSMLQVFLAEPEVETCRNLRRVFCGGEPLPGELAERCRALLAVSLHNQYGPTETSVNATFWTCGHEQPRRTVPIGRPIANMQAYVLDPWMEPVPVGVTGELYLGGAGLGRGYLNRPDLTAERFLPNPFAGVLGDGCWVLGAESSNTQHPSPNTRLYRTGDLVRYRPDGAIEFLGRIDHQVKLRGFRVELDEVAAVLEEHPAVRTSVVAAREDVPGDLRLVAYVVPTNDQRPTTNDQRPSTPGSSSVLSPQSSALRAFLQTRLPDYMVPSAFVLLDALPLGPSGKVDRRALPAPDRARPGLDTPFAASRTPTEALLARIWAEVLGLERVGIHDNFFALGGHSLLATQVVVRMRDALGGALPLRSLFEAPSVAALAARVASDHGAEAAAAPPIRPVARGGPLPLSFAQQRLWFLYQLDRGNPAYAMAAAVQMDGALDRAALAHSLREIVRRHESLRTTFATIDGRPMQLIAAAGGAPLTIVDLRGLPADERTAVVRRMAVAQTWRPFDLERGPLLRSSLLWLGDEAHVLLVTIYHIVADGWSIGVFIRELAALYVASAAGRPAALPALPVQYADYAVWQREWLQGPGAWGLGSGVSRQGDKETRRHGDTETEDRRSKIEDRGSRIFHPPSSILHLPSQPAPCATLVPHPPSPIDVQLAYWKAQLAALPTLELPTDHPRPAASAFRGAQQSLALDHGLTAALNDLSQRAGITLFMTLLAAFQTLLARYSGQDDIAVGSPIANRSRVELEGLIGVFVNILVLRGDLGGNPSFGALLERVREMTLGAYAHQDLPFELLVEELQPARDLSRNPLFQVGFVLQNTPQPALELPGLTLRSLEFDPGTAKFDLWFSLVEQEQRLGGYLEYNTDLFDAATIGRMLGHFQTLLAGVATDPDRRLADLPLLSEAERTQLLTAWNATAAPFPERQCIHELIEAQVARTPDAVAVVFDRSGVRGQEDKETRRQGDKEIIERHAGTPSPIPHPLSPILSPQSSVLSPQCLSYRELDRRANRLARRLQALGVGPETRVGLCVARSPELLIGLLGVLKAGAAYLPLDPAYPAERLAFMLEDAQAPILLTQRAIYDLRFTIYDSPRDDQPPELRTQNSKLKTPISDDQPLELNTQHSKLKTPIVVCLDGARASDESGSTERVNSAVSPDNLAYVIYTSGSTGKPKGVMVSHRNVVNFFTAIDLRLGAEQPGVWLALTSVSFDISVLELCWTLARGFRVVVQPELDGTSEARADATHKELDFSLFYFSSDERSAGDDKYHLLMEGARFADRAGFTAVWTPERHFHAFGGLYPNPSVISAALAAITERVQIRAGSVVLPLHHPVRVAEEWSVVDNLSRGRVGLSFAAGWHADDFIFAPERYAARKQAMLDGIATVRALWRGEAISARGGADNELAVRLFPRPVQAELPVWLTAAGNPETFRTAGAIGANMLTHLLGQELAELAEKIAIYRRAWREHGHGPGMGHVTLMLHTFVGEDLDAVRETVRKPFCDYLRSSLDLIGNLARSFGYDTNAADFSEDDLEALLARAFDRYFATSGLMGTPETCLGMIERLKAIGVDELACLIDFGIDADTVLAHLPALNGLRERSRPAAREGALLSLPEQIDRQRISHLQCTPSLARALLLDQAASAAMRSLRVFLVGGEALPAALAARLRETTPAALFNMYGPTETTIWSAIHPLEEIAGAVPIGRPVANTQIYVLDQYAQPAPIGVAGELCIGGAGVARGYLNRPELTAEKFVPNPFGDKETRRQGDKENGDATPNTQHPTPNTRLYKTGDRARFRPDGSIEFLGRVDQQVKVRGFRIELGEIEAALARHPAVREAAVVAREDALGNRRLVAYVVPDQRPTTNGQQPATIDAEAGDGSSFVVRRSSFVGELRAFLQERLPAYMVPAAFVTLEALPLTPNGKLDRQTLPPEQEQAGPEPAPVAPRTPVEERLAAIWAEALGREQIGVNENFFELGGDSILSLQVISRATREGLRLTLNQLFQHPTIAGLAMVVGAPQLAAASQELMTGPVPLSPIQHWFFEQQLPDPHHWNQALLLEVREPPDPALLERALGYLLIHHDALRLRFTRDGSGWRQAGSAPGGEVPFTRVDLSALPAAEQTAAITARAAELQASLDLAGGPLMRVALLELGPDRPSRLLLIIHHLVVDGISWRVLLEDLQTAYRQLNRSEAVALPPKTASFKAWSEHLAEYARSAALRREQEYWLAEPRAHAPRLPVDDTRPNIVATTDTVEVFLDAEETSALLHEVPPVYRTQINDLLLTALAQAFARWTGAPALLLDLEGHGREAIFEELDISRTVGWFTSLFPVLLRLEATTPPGDAIKSIKEQLRQIPQRGIGYGVLRYLSGSTETVQALRSLPQAEIMFNYLGQFDQMLPEDAAFGMASEPTGPIHSPRGQRRYLLEINGFVVGGRLHLAWTYNVHRHRRATVERLAHDTLEALRGLTAHCLAPEAGGYTPSDFPEAGLLQEELDDILAEFSGSTEEIL